MRSRITKTALRQQMLSVVLLCVGSFCSLPLKAINYLDEPASPVEGSIDYPQVAPQVALPVTFILSQFASIDSPRIFLGGIAECRGYQAVCEESYGIDLGASPSPGESLRLSRDDLTKLVSREFPEVDVSVVGADYVVISSNFQDIDSEWLENELQGAVDRQFAPMKSVRVRVQSVRMLRPLRLRPGSYKASFPEIDRGGQAALDWVMSVYRGSTSMTARIMPSDVDAYFNEDGITEVSFHAQMIIEQLIPVAVNQLEANQLLGPDHFEMRWVKLSRSYVTYVNKMADISGMVLKRSVRAGEPVSAQQLELPRAVKRGDSVKISIRSNGIDVLTSGKALGSGAIGEQVEVQYPSSRRRLRATVTGSSQVEVRL